MNKKLKEQHLLKLSVTYGELLESGQLADVILRINEDVMHCHKVILVAGCPYFARMFQSSMKENVTNEVEMNGVNNLIVRLII